MNILPCGDHGVLVELDDLDSVLALHHELSAAPLPGTVDLVPAARTLLITIDPAVTSPVAAMRAVSQVVPRPYHRLHGGTVDIPVVYDGEDLDEVGRLTGLGCRGVVEAHTGQTWTVAFTGFAPGFGYLAGERDVLHVPRRSSPRVRVDAGAVGLAGEFSGVYPRQSPGGWQLIGRTTARLWDPDRSPPALLQPGVNVRFVEAT